MSDVSTTSQRRAPCESAPLPPQAPCNGATGGLLEMYYDEGTSYLGYVEARSVCSSESAASSGDDDDDFDARLHVAPAPASPAATSAKPAVEPEPVRRMRHNVYALRVMPEWAYMCSPLPPVKLPPLNPSSETDGAAEADGEMPRTDLMPGVIEQPVDGATFPYFDPYLPAEADMRAMHGAVCCYWKQGYCSMGDSCWYPHEGAADAPCHYGASCRKGHRHLARAACAAAKPAAAGASASGETVPRRYVHEAKPPRPSAPLMQTDMECPHCHEIGVVRTQDFPLYEGNRVRQATRGHCSACMRTFMVM